MFYVNPKEYYKENASICCHVGDERDIGRHLNKFNYDKTKLQ